MSDVSPIVFYLLAAAVLVPAVMVVVSENLFHSGIALVTCFMGVAGLYVTLSSPFVAGMQVLVYAGAMMVLFVFVTTAIVYVQQFGRNPAIASYTDALYYTVTTFKPKQVIDLATQTGAIIIALGSYQAGLFSNDDDLSAACKEQGWNLEFKIYRDGPAPKGSSVTATCLLSDLPEIDCPNLNPEG